MPRLTLKVLAQKVLELEERIEELEKQNDPPHVLSPAIGFEVASSRDADLESYDPPLP